MISLQHQGIAVADTAMASLQIFISEQNFDPDSTIGVHAIALDEQTPEGHRRWLVTVTTTAAG